ncbi:restriction endonuclease subunit S [Oxynema aestuarii]|uniref:Restriction endonuclease subunit S n=1 Tax=Oxynema aestuarii AP17 TaxID=2064643 RepID=A0A6H1TYL6_9CYAN|nr:restriction endonuclease subunit S [Oxynema aestuarii]QIZ71237.1 restriction endonuclease subunit S [Oxynema aestuarii AP17]
MTTSSIKNKWTEKTLDECVLMLSGGTPSKRNPDYWNGNICWASAKDLKTFRLYETQDRITSKGASNGTRIAPKGSILILVRGMTLHKDVPISIVMQDMAFNQDIKAIIPDESIIDKSFLVYWLLAFKPYLMGLVDSASHGTGRINTEVLKSTLISFPSISEQKAIAHILGTLDDKIELNQQMNRTLEGIARAIFKSWFIDFDPVRAKMDGRQPAGMDAETAALFPDDFEDSPLGKIPKGWKVETLKQVVKVNPRSVTKNYSHQVIQYVDISSVTTGRLEKTTAYQLSDAPSRAKRLVRHGDTIWSGVRPNRRSYLFIHTPPENLVVSTGFVVLSPKAIPPSYLYAWVTTDEFVDYLTFNADGSAYPAVRPDRFSDAQILIPLPAILDKFELQVGSIRNKIFQSNYESRIMALTRDTLLPKLLSGEIRIKDAEKVLEEVT